MEGFARWMTDGGIWMYFILAVGILSLGVAAERFFFLFFRYNINAGAFMGQVNKLVLANSVDKAIKLCNAAPTAALARVIKAGLAKAGRPGDEIQNAIEEATLEVSPIVQKRTQSLQALANIATLLGLLGTIDGMIDAFAATSDEKIPQADRPKELSKAISKAMLTTAFGLIIAIPTMGFHVFLTGVTKRILDEIDLYSLKLKNMLTSRGGPS